MAKDDFRIKIQVDDGDQAEGLLERLGLELNDEAAELARELKERRLAVSRDGDEIFVYASSPAEAEQARSVVQAVLRDLGVAALTGAVEHWIDAEDRWTDEAPGETWEEEELEHGHAPWEVRVECSTHAAARELAESLRKEGYTVERGWRFVVVGVASKDDATALAARLHGTVEPGGALVWETVPGNPFAVFGGLGSSGTPVG